MNTYKPTASWTYALVAVIAAASVSRLALLILELTL